MLALYSILFILNVVAFGMFAIDKHNASYSRWRIPEAVLLGLAVMGGAYGAGMGMMLFRHKTLHRVFLITVPLFFVIWMLILIVLAATP